MAAKSKKRLSRVENKLLKLDKLQLQDVLCSICQSILVEPVTLPCFHDFCYRCFNGSIQHNALCCPLCRLRIGSWLRTATKQKALVNVKLWDFINSKFSNEINTKLKGEDIKLEDDLPLHRLSKPGEIRMEYEAELRRLRQERMETENISETKVLISKIQQEQSEDNEKYLEILKKDEIFAKKIQDQERKLCKSPTPRKSSLRLNGLKPRLKAAKIDCYLSKVPVPVPVQNTLLTDDISCINGSTSKALTAKSSITPIIGSSPEMVPSYGKCMKNLIDKKNKLGPGLWNKENGEKLKLEKKEDAQLEKPQEKNKKKLKSTIPSLLVSLPLPYSGILQHKINICENRSKETGSADSMREELCFFKPIESTTPISFNTNKLLPLRVPVLRAEKEPTSPSHEPAPSRSQYLEGLCRLRNLSIEKNMPSAFVIALSILKDKTCSEKFETSNQVTKNTTSTNSSMDSPLTVRRYPNRNKQTTQTSRITYDNSNKNNRRRTRSMGSVPKDENETTPIKTKVKQRKVSSERKPHLRSSSKKSNTKKEEDSPPLISKLINNNKLNLAVKNLSSPLENCDVKIILHQQLQIEKIIDQEKNDLELARKIQIEWNGRRFPQRTAAKRQVTLNYALRPAKKLKV